MKVCICQGLELDDIVNAMEKAGNDPEAIRQLTQAGKGCGECLDPSCEEVELPFPHALLNAEAILKNK